MKKRTENIADLLRVIRRIFEDDQIKPSEMVSFLFDINYKIGQSLEWLKCDIIESGIDEEFRDPVYLKVLWFHFFYTSAAYFADNKDVNIDEFIELACNDLKNTLKIVVKEYCLGEIKGKSYERNE